MYIESANLSERHAEIKFVESCKYLLRDCNSDTGTWIRIGHPGESKDYYSISGNGSDWGSGIDLYQESRLRMFKAGEYQFVVEEDPSSLFDEVVTWLSANYF